MHQRLRCYGVPAFVVMITILILSLLSNTATTTAAGNTDPSSSSTAPARKNAFWNSSLLCREKPFAPRRRKRRRPETTDNYDDRFELDDSENINDTKTADRDDESESESKDPTTTTTTTMGQAMRMYRYDRDENERNAIEGLAIQGEGGAATSTSRSTSTFEWHRLDDGVMGGRSETVHRTNPSTGALRFEGTINTNGGGFCSVRSPIPDDDRGLPRGITGIRLRFRGDGKTYKLTLSDGAKSKFGPSKTGSWQHDIPTKPMVAPAASEEKKSEENGDDEENDDDDDDDDFETMTIPFSALESSFGPWAKTEAQKAVRFDVGSMRQIGFMLSTKLSDGSTNPVETFGKGIFPFSLEILSIDPVFGTEPEIS